MPAGHLDLEYATLANTFEHQRKHLLSLQVQTHWQFLLSQKEFTSIRPAFLGSALADAWKAESWEGLPNWASDARSEHLSL